MADQAPNSLLLSAPPQLVGRERERATLRAALDAALAGRGSLVLIGGEAGIGKSALAEWLLAEAVGQGALVLVGRCYDLAEAPPYGPWCDIGLFARRGVSDMLTPERRRILAFLREWPAATPAQVALGLGITPANAAQALRRLLARGLVTQPRYGSYSLPTGGAVGASQIGQSGQTSPPDVPALLAATQDGAQPGPRSQDALVEQIRDHLVALAARQPMVILLEDMHWADPASVGLLRVVARDLVGLPILILATYRADELTRHQSLYRLLPALVREGQAARLDLARLGDDHVRALVRGRYGLAPDDEPRLADYLASRAEGNPFFTGELLRSLEGAGVLRQRSGGWALGDLDELRLPPLVLQVINARCDRLGEDARAMLEVAAVLGQVVPLDLWLTVAAIDESTLSDVVERAAAAHLLAETADGQRVQFAHALVREALYEGLHGLRRRALHRRATAALLATSHPDPDAVAYHLRQAGDLRAAEWLVRAGERAQAAYAWQTAAARYEAALALLAEQGDAESERGWLLVRLSLLREYIDPSRGIAELDEAAHLAAASSDRLLAAAALFRRGLLRSLGGEARRGVAEMAAGAAARDALPPREREHVARRSITGAPDAHWHELVFGLRVAAGHYVRAAAGAGRRQPPRTANMAEQELAGRALLNAALGYPAEAARDYTRAHRAHVAGGDHLNAGLAALNALRYVALPYRTADLSARRQLADAAEAAFARAQRHNPRLPPLQGRLPLLLLEGDWDEARAVALAALADGVHAAHLAHARSILGPLARAQGDAALAWAQVRAALPAGVATPPGDALEFRDHLELQRLAACLACDAGALPEARAWLVAHDAWLAWSGSLLGRAEAALAWAAYHRSAGDAAQAGECAARALALATAPRQPLTLLNAHRISGELAAAAGQYADAASQLAAALALANACVAPYERALTLLALTELHLAAHRIGEAEQPLAEARATFARLKALPASVRADSLAAQFPIVRAPCAHPGGLTAREVDVLRLVAAGCSTREAATALSVSERTVERHLGNLYRKIGARNRADATAYALRHQPA